MRPRPKRAIIIIIIITHHSLILPWVPRLLEPPLPFHGSTPPDGSPEAIDGEGGDTGHVLDEEMKAHAAGGSITPRAHVDVRVRAAEDK